MSEQPSPGEAAKVEAAKQAVGLAFAMASVVLLIWMQKRMGGGISGMITAAHDEIDPSGAALRKMEAAQADEKRWHGVTVWLWRFGPWKAARWAHRRAETARKAYERERWS